MNQQKEEQKEEQAINIRKRAVEFFNKNSPIFAAGGVGIIVGMFILGQLVNGIRVSTKDGFEIVVDRTALPTEFNVEGEWLYKAETNGPDIRFIEDKCRIRMGTVRIKQKLGTPEVILSGRRLVRTDCDGKEKTLVGTAIPWDSSDAVVKQREGQIFLWLSTGDDKQRFGYVSANIQGEKGKTPSEIHGNMFYLENANNTWFKAKIDFYRIGTSKAVALEATYPPLKDAVEKP
jgi:hypothetical protein